MEIRIVSDNLSILNKQKERIEKKLNSLERFLKRYSIHKLEIIFSQSNFQEKGEIFSAQIRVILPGKDLLLEEKEGDIDVLISKIYKAIKNQVINLKEKKQSRIKRLARVIKEKFFR
jgi:ribosomal subunit interface protein